VRLLHKVPAVPVVLDDSDMPQNFIECDREQVLLMPPSLREWLSEDHFAWFVLAAVEHESAGLDLRSPP
jgi:hypothetical protein